MNHHNEHNHGVVRMHKESNVFLASLPMYHNHKTLTCFFDMHVINSSPGHFSSWSNSELLLLFPNVLCSSECLPITLAMAGVSTPFRFTVKLSPSRVLVSEPSLFCGPRMVSWALTDCNPLFSPADPPSSSITLNTPTTSFCNLLLFRVALSASVIEYKQLLISKCMHFKSFLYIYVQFYISTFLPSRPVKY